MLKSNRLSAAGSDAPLNSGLYQLVVRLREGRVIGVGRRGRFPFPAGYYVYTGSAMRGLESRIERHMRRRKRMRWHIDYLLPYGRIVEVKRYGSVLSECELSRGVGGAPRQQDSSPRLRLVGLQVPNPSVLLSAEPAERIIPGGGAMNRGGALTVQCCQANLPRYRIVL